jgi:GNAT superfamily N-acetyltransferase
MTDSETLRTPVPNTDDATKAQVGAEGRAPASSRDQAGRGWVWVPIRSLGPRHRPKIALHLLSLDVSDRYLRFGYSASDSQIMKYVDLLDFDRDEVFGIFNRRLEVVAVAHLAHQVESDRPASEFGVSVLAKARRRGFGHRLFEHAMLHARNRGVQHLFIHALSENGAMLKIARDSGATVERFGAETQAWLQLPPDTIASRVGEIVEQRAAEIDYQIKLHARHADSGDAVGAIPVDSHFGG